MIAKTLATGSRGNCHLLIGEHETLILDMGIRFADIKKGLRYQLGNVVGALVTHQHKDHAMAAAEACQQGLAIFSNRSTLEACHISEHPYAHCVEARKPFRVGGFMITPYAVEHDAPNMAFVIIHPEMGKLLYCTDMSDFRVAVKGLNHIFIEANYDSEILINNAWDSESMRYRINRLVDTHCSLDASIAIINSLACDVTQNVVLMHLSSDNADASLFKARAEALTGLPVAIAEPNLITPLSL